MLAFAEKKNIRAKKITPALKAVGDETRLRILHILSFGSFSVNEITEILGMGQSRISRHLKILTEAELLISEREGTWVYYRIPEKKSEFEFSSDLGSLLLSYKEDLPYREADQKKVSEVLSNREVRKSGYFNKIGKNWERLQSDVMNPTIYREKILSYLPSSNKMILDLGCGPGGLFPFLLKKSSKVTGVDSSVKMIEEAGLSFRKEKRVEVIHSFLENLPMSSNFSDAVVASMVLHHVSNPKYVMEEVWRVLKTDGVFCIIDLKKHNAEYMRENFADLWLGFDKELLCDWLKTSGFVIKKTEEMKTQSEFKVLAIKAIKKGGQDVHSNKRTNTKVQG